MTPAAMVLLDLPLFLSPLKGLHVTQAAGRVAAGLQKNYAAESDAVATAF